MKKLIPAYILSFVISIMLFIMEPLTLFASNRDDFRFNLSHFIIPLLLTFFIVFILLSLIYTIVFLICKKFTKKLLPYNIILVVSFILFIMSYIQGNFLAGNLPRLDGTTPNWNDYGIDNIITFSILIIITIVYIICLIKYKFDKVINASKYITISIFIMFLTGFIPTMLNSNLYEDRKILYISNDHINDLSSNKNFLIFLVDAVDSGLFSKSVQEVNNNLFNDFTYYPDTISIYPFTRDSIPQILSGQINYNETSFPEYYNKSMDKSSLINKLIEDKYDIYLYEADLLWNTDKSSVVSNAKEYNEKISSFCFAKQESRYILFKYLPYFLKKYSNIDTFNFNYCKIAENEDEFSINDIDYYESLNNELNIVDNNYFQFVHIDGAHVPFDLDENLNKIENGTYEQKVKATIKIIDKYLKRLKDNNLYDNSAIIILSDHGYSHKNGVGRHNPILYIKGFNENHEMITSDKSILYSDLVNAYEDLINGKKSSELFSSIPNERERYFIKYDYLNENHMVEYKTSDKAWEIEKYIKTGKEYNR